MSADSNRLAGAGGRQPRQKLATRSLWRTYWDRRARRATVLLLEALDDRALKDIGLSRSQIESIVLGIGEDPDATEPALARSTARCRERRA